MSVINKSSWISLEIMVFAIVTAITITTTSVVMSSRISQNTENISRIEQSLVGIEATLDEISFNVRLKNEVDVLIMRDRWTSANMVEYSDKLFEFLRKNHMDILKDDFPCVKKIIE